MIISRHDVWWWWWCLATLSPLVLGLFDLLVYLLTPSYMLMKVEVKELQWLHDVISLWNAEHHYKVKVADELSYAETMMELNLFFHRSHSWRCEDGFLMHSARLSLMMMMCDSFSSAGMHADLSDLVSVCALSILRCRQHHSSLTEFRALRKGWVSLSANGWVS